ncbi:MAG: hypothetical protein E6Q97_18100 [Desulfurellales bacterium]|nr:MAG: hypothetical protein E6Q97_18100 [Desulfurellales bacterium]
MSSLEDIVSAAMAAPPYRREEALRLLRGQLAKPEPYVTLRGLARATGFSVTTLRRWEVPGHVVGGARRYRLSEVEEYFRSSEFRRRVAALRVERRIAVHPTMRSPVV